MYDIKEITNKILKGDTLEELRKIPSNSINVCITSPPYWGLRDYEVDGQIGREGSYIEYLDRLKDIFAEVNRVLTKDGACWVNIGDVYMQKNMEKLRKKSLVGIPDRLKVNMIDSGWICRNEIIWHKPNAMPSSAKTRFNADYEKMFFFTKESHYKFHTQYEESVTKETKNKNVEGASKYKSIAQESSVRQGMNRQRGCNIVEKRPLLPSQQVFVDFIRKITTIQFIVENTNIKKTKVEHWFRRDVGGFAFPSKEDWRKVCDIISNKDEEFNEMTQRMEYVEYETDDINKNISRGRIKRAVWSIPTKPFKGGHFAPFPEDLIKTPILSCSDEGDIILDIFMGSGTTGLVAKKNNRKYIGIELNEEYIDIANKRISEKK